jgi:hypothetical protein
VIGRLRRQHFNPNGMPKVVMPVGSRPRRGRSTASAPISARSAGTSIWGILPPMTRHGAISCQSGGEPPGRPTVTPSPSAHLRTGRCQPCGQR